MMSLFNQKMTLIARVDTGQTDDHNQPVYEDVSVGVRGTFWQNDAADRDQSSDVVSEDDKIGFLRCGVRPKAGDAIVVVAEGDTVRYEIVGPPEPKFEPRGRSGRVHHWEAKVRRAAA